MASIKLRHGAEMVLDDDDVELFNGVMLYEVRSRNMVYAYFGKCSIAHRVIMGVTDPKMVVDHLNGNGLDNRRVNLRVVTSIDNVKNRQVSRNKVSGLPPGIFMDKGRYFVQVTENYKKIFLGRFDILDEAVVALNKKRKELGRPEVSRPTHINHCSPRH